MLLGINRALGAAARIPRHWLWHRGKLIARGTALAAACAVTACTGPPSTGTPGTASSAQDSVTSPPAEQTIGATSGSWAHPAAAWPTFGQNARRTGIAPGLAAAGALTRRWAAALDAAVYAQPLVVGGYVIAATENDTVYALNATTGAVVWKTHVATPVPLSTLPCGDIDPLGITGTPVYDQANGIVYAVAETKVSSGGRTYYHELVGLSVSDGAVRIRRIIPLAAGHDYAHQQRAALALSDGHVFVAFGGLAGDCDQYTGTVVAVPASGGGALASWLVPTSREGGIWAIGGPVAGPDGDLWVSVGNGANRPGQPYDGSDSVTRLSLSAGNVLSRRDFFAPASWASDNVGDADLGSTQPALAANDATFIMGKSGTGYLLSTSSLGGIGGQRASKSICPAYGAGAVSGGTVYEPCDSGGLAAIAVNAAARTINVLWRGPAGARGSPSIGGGAVWVTGGDGVLYELDPATGAVRDQIRVGTPLPRFSSVSLAGDDAFVGTSNGVVAVSGA